MDLKDLVELAKEAKLPLEISQNLLREIKLPPELRQKISELLNGADPAVPLDEDRAQISDYTSTLPRLGSKNRSVFPNQYYSLAAGVFVLAVESRKYFDILDSLVVLNEWDHPPSKKELENKINASTLPAIVSLANDSCQCALFTDFVTKPAARLESKEIFSKDGVRRQSSDCFTSLILTQVQTPNSSSNALGELIYKLTSNIAVYKEIHEFYRDLPAILPNALVSLSSVSSHETKLIIELLKKRKNVLLEGVPGTGKSRQIEQLVNAKSDAGASLYHGATVVVMHPAVSYEDMIEGVKPRVGGDCDGSNFCAVGEMESYLSAYGHKERSPTEAGPFTIRAGRIVMACVEACRDPSKLYLLVLDELNRCNVPRALGELLLLLEDSKRAVRRDETGGWHCDTPAKLPLSGLKFFVPENLHVLATMNTADRSTASLDQALRRRFAFHRLEPMSPAALCNDPLIVGHSANFRGSIDAWGALNSTLREQIGPDQMLGHSYFFGAALAVSRGQSAENALAEMWQHSLLPQLIEILTSNDRFELAQSDELSRALRIYDLSLVTHGTGIQQDIQVINSQPTTHGVASEQENE